MGYDPIRSPWTIRGTVFVVALVGLLLPYLGILLDGWTRGGKDAAGSLLATGGALILLWQRRAALRDTAALEGGHPARATLALALAAALVALSSWADFRVGLALASVGVLAALLHHRGGRTLLSAWTAPLVLLVLATPLPGFVLTALTAHLLRLARSLGAALLDPLVGPVAVNGYRLSFPTGSVDLVADCSGLGGLLLFLPVTVLLTVFAGPHGPLARTVLVVAAVPAALLGNLLRITTTALLVHGDSPWARSPGFHEILGLVVLALPLAALVLLALLTRRRT